ncbi:HEAT repeat domain-containing protein, partial [Candidatus Fermentibacterales bacterium]|nr:HEAT repeat domain-containing protein [Candidatus Fermentibacterales bacterium]
MVGVVEGTERSPGPCVWWVGEDLPFPSGSNHAALTHVAVDPECLTAPQEARPAALVCSSAAIPDRQDGWLREVPLILISGEGSDPVAMYREGAWSVIPDCASRELVVSVVERLVSRWLSGRELNPLTGLPGNTAIEERLRDAVRSGRGTVAYLDIRSFKPFNDRYGFARGDAVIRLLAAVLREALARNGGSDEVAGAWFAGHVGGDDFILMGEGREFRERVTRAAAAFAARAALLCDERDRSRGFMEAVARDGSFRKIPLPSVSVAFVEASGCATVEELAWKAARGKMVQRGERHRGDAFEILRSGGESLLRSLCHPPPSRLAGAKALVEAAGELGDGRLVPMLASILRGSPSSRVRKSAAYALGRIGGPEVVPLLADALSDESPHVRTRALDGLALAGLGACSSLLVPMASDPSTWVRQAAYRAMGLCGCRECSELLRRAVLRTGRSRSRVQVLEQKAALEGMGSLGVARDSGFIVSLLARNGISARRAAWTAVARIGGEEALSALSQAAAGGDRPAVDALAFVGPSLREGSESLERLEGTVISLSRSGRLGLRKAVSLLSAFPGRPGEGATGFLLGLLGCRSPELPLEELLYCLRTRRVPAARGHLPSLLARWA